MSTETALKELYDAADLRDRLAEAHFNKGKKCKAEAKEFRVVAGRIKNKLHSKSRDN